MKGEIKSESCLTCTCTLYDPMYVRTLEKKLAWIREHQDKLGVQCDENIVNEFKKILK